MISIVIPYHDMENGAFFLKRAIDSIMAQTFPEYEIILTKAGKMAENTNAGIKKAHGDIVKILYMDDYLAHPLALQNIFNGFKGGAEWLVTACEHDNGSGRGNAHYIKNEERVLEGINTIGSPSVLAFRNQSRNFTITHKDENEYFDEQMSWMLDVDVYKRLWKKHGKPAILDSIDTVIGLHGGQMTHILTEEQKQAEVNYFNTK